MATTYEDTSLTLIFTPSNPINTTITNARDGALLYRVVTEFGSKSSHTETRVVSATGETLASWVWKQIRPDILTLGNAAPVSMSTWLKKSMMPFNDTTTFSIPTDPSKEYQWKGHTLSSKDDKSDSIAVFTPSRWIPRSRLTPEEMKSGIRSTPAKLVVDAEGKEILDYIIISFSVLERQRRAKENNRNSVNEGRIIASSTLAPMTAV
ncbi:hypothetical protein BDP27DRAFT_1333784 [Rhodocollybia butyracea]|uniref:DUF6593 domain-containing protein n=1 Tax=Rhodocollybia butyracea TaxID=206335 RepID=A0A9P5PEN3_9AGAR|nr:hypothetical protein BDP27DRAFT_1333784 [Rhodocollybia butyracea]